MVVMVIAHCDVEEVEGPRKARQEVSSQPECDY